MIRVCANESFPIVVTLLDEETGQAASGKIVYYDIRKQPEDSPLVPPISGTLTESMVEAGIYKTAQLPTISGVGSYIIYATCSGFISGTEELNVVEEADYSDLSALVKQTRHYNISVEDVIRTNDDPIPSQIVRKVPHGRTDYVITKIKRDSDSDWSGAYVAEGRTYAWYSRTNAKTPYKMGDDGL
jgi:hypothetical protein